MDRRAGQDEAGGRQAATIRVQTGTACRLGGIRDKAAASHQSRVVYSKNTTRRELKSLVKAVLCL